MPGLRDRTEDVARLRLGIDGICTNFRDRAAALLDGEGRA